jgi:hypothetical protein
MAINNALEIHASLPETVTGQSAVVTNYNASGAVFFFDVTAVSGTTPSLTFKLQAFDTTSGKFVDVAGAATVAITATGTFALAVAPGITVVANAAIAAQLPFAWRIVWTITGTTPSFTFTASTHLCGGN